MQKKPNNNSRKRDTLVINTAEGKANAWEARKAVSIQPGFQGYILKERQTDFNMQQIFHFI